MGGHDHKRPYEVPDWRKFKWEESPQLVAHQKRLSARGLKDPWLRNESWRFVGYPGPVRMFVKGFRGWQWGALAFLVAIGVERYFHIDYKYGHKSVYGDHH